MRDLDRFYRGLQSAYKFVGPPYDRAIFVPAPGHLVEVAILRDVNGRIAEVRGLDEDGRPIRIGFGYAVTDRVRSAEATLVRGARVEARIAVGWHSPLYSGRLLFPGHDVHVAFHGEAAEDCVTLQINFNDHLFEGTIRPDDASVAPLEGFRKAVCGAHAKGREVPLSALYPELLTPLLAELDRLGVQVRPSPGQSRWWEALACTAGTAGAGFVGGPRLAAAYGFVCFAAAAYS